jgi:hypothetical protein
LGASAHNVLDCLLFFKRSYRADDPFVTHRVQQFTKRHPEITTLAALKRLLEDYDTLTAFGRHELDYTHGPRLETLPYLLGYLLRVQDDYAGANELTRLAQWANTARPYDSHAIQMTEFSLAGFQYLRMLFGAQAADRTSI